MTKRLGDRLAGQAGCSGLRSCGVGPDDGVEDAEQAAPAGDERDLLGLSACDKLGMVGADDRGAARGGRRRHEDRTLRALMRPPARARWRAGPGGVLTVASEVRRTLDARLAAPVACQADQLDQLLSARDRIGQRLRLLRSDRMGYEADAPGRWPPAPPAQGQVRADHPRAGRTRTSARNEAVP